MEFATVPFALARYRLGFAILSETNHLTVMAKEQREYDPGWTMQRLALSDDFAVDKFIKLMQAIIKMIMLIIRNM